MLVADGSARSRPVGPSRRSRAAGGRPHQLGVLFSSEELAVVQVAAERAGMAPRAWLGDIAVRAAAGRLSVDAMGVSRDSLFELMALVRELQEARAELGEVRRVLRNVGGNLNDVARIANSTGEVAAETVTVERLVARVVGSVDAVVATMDAAATAAALTAGRGRAGGRRRGRGGVDA